MDFKEYHLLEEGYYQWQVLSLDMSFVSLPAFINVAQYNPVFWPCFKLLSILKSKLLNIKLV